MDDLKVVLLTKKDLSAHLEASSNEREYPLPFSENKAQWLLEKPGMLDDDYCAVLATSNNKILSFAYLVPDTLSTGDKNLTTEDKKIYWMPQWWASEKAKSTVVSTYVFSEALRATNNRVLTKAYEQNAEDFYKRQPFTLLQTTERHVVFISLSSDVLVQRVPILKNLRFFTNWLEKSSFKTYGLLNRSKVKKLTNGIEILYIHRLDNDGWEFVKPFVKGDLIMKSKDYVNWQMDSRQYLPLPWTEKRRNSALIRGFGSKIGIVSYMVSRENVNIGFVSFHYLGDTAYMKYCLADQKNMPTISATVYKHLSILNINYLYTDNQALVQHLKENISIVYHYAQTKKAMAHNSIFSLVEHAVLTEQDGHFI